MVKQKEKEISRTLEEIEAQEKELAAEKKQAIKEVKKDAVAEVKRLILKHNLTKGDIRGKATSKSANQATRKCWNVIALTHY